MVVSRLFFSRKCSQWLSTGRRTSSIAMVVANGLASPSPAGLCDIGLGNERHPLLRTSETVSAVKKRVEDVLPIATRHEREEIEAELEGKKRFDMDAPEGPFGTKSSFLWGYLVSSVAGGALADIYGGKRVMAWGAVLWSLATFLTPLAAEHSIGMLLAVRILFGLAEGVALPSMNTLLSRDTCSSTTRSNSLLLSFLKHFDMLLFQHYIYTFRFSVAISCFLFQIVIPLYLSLSCFALFPNFCGIYPLLLENYTCICYNHYWRKFKSRS